MLRPLGSRSATVTFSGHSVGRPGLDPGTLGLKEGSGLSEPTTCVGNVLNNGKTCLMSSTLFSVVGSVRGMKRGIFYECLDRSHHLRAAIEQRKISTAMGSGG